MSEFCIKMQYIFLFVFSLQIFSERKCQAYAVIVQLILSTSRLQCTCRCKGSKSKFFHCLHGSLLCCHILEKMKTTASSWGVGGGGDLPSFRNISFIYSNTMNRTKQHAVIPVNQNSLLGSHSFTVKVTLHFKNVQNNFVRFIININYFIYSLKKG